MQAQRRAAAPRAWDSQAAAAPSRAMAIWSIPMVLA
jgi:hypothetical protein